MTQKLPFRVRLADFELNLETGNWKEGLALPYVEVLGGGMVMAYRAEDLKLGRAVELMFLSAEIGNDARALRRFE